MTAGSGQFSGQRAQKPHLVRGGGGLSGEVADLRSDIQRDFAANAAIAVENFVDVAAADDDAIVTALATVAAPVVLTGAALDGVVGEGVMDPPRNISITTAGATPADAPATVTVKGTDIDGNPLEITDSVPQTASTTQNEEAAFRTVTEVSYPAADGTAATVAIGFGPHIGTSKDVADIDGAGQGALLNEFVDGAAPGVAGDIAAPENTPALPHGLYLPGDAPNGTRDYRIYYEYDASKNT